MASMQVRMDEDYLQGPGGPINQSDEERQVSPLRELNVEVVDPIAICREGFVAVTGVGENPPEGGQVSSNNLQGGPARTTGNTYSQNGPLSRPSVNKASSGSGFNRLQPLGTLGRQGSAPP